LVAKLNKHSVTVFWVIEAGPEAFQVFVHVTKEKYDAIDDCMREVETQNSEGAEVCL
jgi:hypothetical protein